MFRFVLLSVVAIVGLSLQGCEEIDPMAGVPAPPAGAVSDTAAKCRREVQHSFDLGEISGSEKADQQRQCI
jgi:hypothetical protein